MRSINYVDVYEVNGSYDSEVQGMEVKSAEEGPYVVLSIGQYSFKVGAESLLKAAENCYNAVVPKARQ
jgi:hypothetical protein